MHEVILNQRRAKAMNELVDISREIGKKRKMKKEVIDALTPPSFVKDQRVIDLSKIEAVVEFMKVLADDLGVKLGKPDEYVNNEVVTEPDQESQTTPASEPSTDDASNGASDDTPPAPGDEPTIEEVVEETPKSGKSKRK